ncbi:MAG: hypothetical protein USCGTAYLOR_02471 [Chromatiales bacterium USCg_Taylor]|nr:MAG: hypothetical protein USCGTAYLOR_02471 [Chromatiales bacterium USCg_Taylor]
MHGARCVASVRSVSEFGAEPETLLLVNHPPFGLRFGDTCACICRAVAARFVGPVEVASHPGAQDADETPHIGVERAAEAGQELRYPHKYDCIISQLDKNTVREPA